MSDSNTGHITALQLAINILNRGNGQPAIQYAASGEFIRPDSHQERMDWVSKSYERFLQKVLEKEELVGTPPTNIS